MDLTNAGYIYSLKGLCNGYESLMTGYYYTPLEGEKAYRGRGRALHLKLCVL